MALRAAWLGALLFALIPIPGAAQSGPRVVVLAPEGIRAELCEALAVELSARGATVAPGGEAEDGDVVVAVRRGDEGLGMELRRRGGRTVRVPRLDATDGRSLAVVAASLLDEVERPAPRARPNGPDGPGIGEALTTPLAEQPPGEEPPAPERPPEEARGEARFFADPIDEARAARERVVSEHGAFFGGSLGGMFMYNDAYAVGGGLASRLRVGYRFRRLFRAAASLQFALPSQEDSGVELQPTFLPCLELTGTATVDWLSLHLGAKGCVFVQEWRHFPIDRFMFGERDQWVAGYAAGGYLAASVFVVDNTALWLRLDLAGVEPDLFGPVNDLTHRRRASAFVGEISLGFTIE